MTRSVGPGNYYTYDQYGNTVSESVYKSGLELYTRTFYTEDGNFRTGIADTRGNESQTEYDPNTGLLLSQTDPNGNRTAYTYNEKQLLTRTSHTDTDGTSTENNYLYDGEDRLTGITHNGFSYQFQYDSFGNSIGTGITGTDGEVYPLMSNTYQTGNGKLLKTAYANGYTEEPVYNRLEQKTGTTISNGRMDQYFYPFYKKDMEAGILTDEKTLEYLECMWVGMAEFIDMYISPAGGAFNEGYAHWEAVTIGGQTPDGRDATNDLTYLFLKSKREFPLHYPDLAARIHSRAPERYLWDVAETIKFGSGFPKLCNDEECIPLYVSKGATFEEALDYAVSGCIEIRMPNRDTYTSGGAYTNFASAVEMALYDGKMKKYGDVQLGIQTGDARKFKSWDEFWNAYVQQHMLLLRTTFIQQYIVIQTRAKHFAQPMGSVLHALCRKHCIDLHQPQIPEGLNFGYFEFMGLGTVIDSLAAIKKLVFEDKKLTMDQLIDALEANFEGYEDIQQLLRTAPCYGNDDEYADEIGRELDRMAVSFAAKYGKEMGNNNDLSRALR